MTTDVPPPAIGTIELPDPRGPITNDFKRGACYAARIVTSEQKYIAKAQGEKFTTGTTITIYVPGGQFECSEGKP